MSEVAGIGVYAGFSLEMFAQQITWMSENAIRIPLWLSELILESDQRCVVFARHRAVRVEEFRAFRKLLHRRFNREYKRGEVADACEGLMAFFDYLYDEIDKVVPWDRPWSAR
jgi:hypothetical protein